ncbi:MAG: NusG domain II-containing protein [Monoglobales bacterium]
MIKKVDLFIAIAVIVISLSGYFLTGISLAGEEKTVIIESEGRVFAKYPMTETRTVDVKGRNTVEITPEYVRVTYADCPDKLDVRQGKISSCGGIIVCMPNKMTVRIVGESEIDAVSY